MTLQTICILGIDPGLRNTGWGIVDAEGARLSFVASGCVRSDGDAPMGQRLRQLHLGLMEVIALHAPGEAAVEETFVNRDPQSALKLGQARGVALTAPALAGLDVEEYAANLVKKTVVGNGHATRRDCDDGARAAAVGSPPARTRRTRWRWRPATRSIVGRACWSAGWPRGHDGAGA